MLFVPNVIERVVATDEENMPVVKSNPPRSRVPAVNVIVPVAAIEKAAPNVIVPAVLLIVNAASVVLVLLVRVPVPTMVGVTVVNVPPLDNVSPPAMLSAVVPGLKAVVPKLKFLNQLAVVNVCTAVPLPVKLKLGALVAVPPVVPNT